MSNRVRILATLPVVAAILAPIAAAQSGPRTNLLTFGIVGSTGNAPARINPTLQLDHLAVQRLVLALAAAPQQQPYVDSALAGTGLTADDLVTTELLRRDGGQYRIGLALFTRADVIKVRAVADAEAALLAEAYLARRGEIDQLLSRYSAQTVDRRVLAYILIGCFSLDWDGLALTAEKRYRAATRSHPGGGSYGVWAEERGGLSLKGIYWGSHNASYGNETVTFTSFGDHFSLPRVGLPDLLWRMGGAVSGAVADSGLKGTVSMAGVEGMSELGAMLGRVMFTLREGTLDSTQLATRLNMSLLRVSRLVGLLRGLGYVQPSGSKWGIAVPVFTASDSGMVNAVLRLSREVMTDWLAQRHSAIQQQLAGLSAVKAGVPYGDMFTQIWHYLFGTTNRMLVEKGLFADPYRRPAPGFIPAVWDPGLVALP